MSYPTNPLFNEDSTGLYTFEFECEEEYVTAEPIEYCQFPSEDLDMMGEPYDCYEPAVARIHWYKNSVMPVCPTHYREIRDEYKELAE